MDGTQEREGVEHRMVPNASWGIDPFQHTVSTYHLVSDTRSIWVAQTDLHIRPEGPRHARARAGHARARAGHARARTANEAPRHDRTVVVVVVLAP